MSQDIIAKRFTRIGPTQDRSNCRLEFELLNGKMGALSFPSDQAQPLLELLLQVETQAVEQSEESPGAKTVLYTDSVEAAFQAETQTIILTFLVDKARFGFALPREDAVRLMAIVSERSPSH